MAPALGGLQKPTGYGGISFWLDALPGRLVARAPLERDLECDVAIVGGGYTGLWTAYYLRQVDRSLRVAVLESDVCGYGASGRNGGWCSGRLAASWSRIARESGVEQATAIRRAMESTVDEVGQVAVAERIHCDFAKGGTIDAARTELQLARARAEVEAARQAGVGEEDLSMLDAEQASAILGADGVLGGTYSPHCAALQPAALVRGLAEAVERHGVKVYEKSPVLRIRSHELLCRGGTVRARSIVRATEGYTRKLASNGRELIPIYSLMLATAPLPPAQWESIGLARRETFSDYRHLFIYGQRTADDRLAFGGRGAPYHFGSAVQPHFDRDVRVHAALSRSIVALFPQLRGIEVTHRWGGPIGVPRDWYPSVGLDRDTGIGWAGGYVGYGVAAANLAGRTLADLVCGRDSEITRLPWVGHRSPRWEHEPFRFAGINLGLRAMARGDRYEERTGRPSKRAEMFERMVHP